MQISELLKKLQNYTEKVINKSVTEILLFSVSTMSPETILEKIKMYEPRTSCLVEKLQINVKI